MNRDVCVRFSTSETNPQLKKPQTLECRKEVDRQHNDIRVNYMVKSFLMTVRDRVAQIQPNAVVCLLVVRQTDVR